VESKLFLPLICLFIFLSAGLTIFAHYLRPKHTVFFYLFKPLTTILILSVALLPGTLLSDPYARAIALGLVFSLAGDICLMLPGNRFLFGLVSFLIAHICYIIAFFPGALRNGVIWTLLPLALVGAIILGYLWPALSAGLKAAVSLYVAVIVAMAWLAAGPAIAGSSAGALSAALGALLFMASDATLAIDRFRRPFRMAQAVILGSYYLGQLLIALSIGLRIGG
jgi:uncharacterized membrane protein YhhN